MSHILLGKGVKIRPGGWVINRCSGMARNSFTVLGRAWGSKTTLRPYLSRMEGSKAPPHYLGLSGVNWAGQKPCFAAQL